MWAIGMAIAVMATGAREFATGNFLVQQPVLTREDIRGAFTVMVVISTLIAASLAALAPVLASIYGEAKLIAFLRVAAIAILLEVVAVPLTALMRREMAFLDLAIVNVGTVAVFSVMSVVLAAFGWSYMSFAWAWIVAAATSAVLALRFRPDWWVLKPLLQRWRGMLTFGGYNGVNVLLYRMYEILPILILSRVVSLDAVGLYNRTLLVCQVPDKIILGGALPVILPALSAEVRAGANLKGSYLRAVSFITVLQWPTLVLLARSRSARGPNPARRAMARNRTAGAHHGPGVAVFLHGRTQPPRPRIRRSHARPPAARPNRLAAVGSDYRLCLPVRTNGGGTQLLCHHSLAGLYLAMVCAPACHLYVDRPWPGRLEERCDHGLQRDRPFGRGCVVGMAFQYFIDGCHIRELAGGLWLDGRPPCHPPPPS